MLDLPCLSYWRSEDEMLANSASKFKFPWKGDCRTYDHGSYNGDFWPTLQKLVNVTNIDLCWLSQNGDLVVPGRVFPKAISVRLAGCTTPDTIECILSQSVQSLQRLELHNVLKWSDFTTPLSRIRDWDEWKDYWEENADKHDIVEESVKMIGALRPLVGKCTALTSLSIMTVGDELAAYHDHFNEQLYNEWSCFIDSVRGQLRYLTFKQGISRNDGAGTRCTTTWMRRRKLDHRPMDQLFHTWILPVLLREPWPHMRRMEIRGVGHGFDYDWVQHLPANEEQAGRESSEYIFDTQPGWDYHRRHIKVAFDPLAREQLRTVLPDDAELIIDEEAERDYEDSDSRNDLTGIEFVDEYHVGCCGPRADANNEWYGTINDEDIPLSWRELVASGSVI